MHAPKSPFRAFLSAAALILALQSITVARSFEDKFGRKLEAELVSHTGKDAETVKMLKGGKEIEVKVELFSAKDQTFIREWMKKTPPTVNYAFRVEAAKKQLTTTARSTTYSRFKEGQWGYEVEVTNLTRQTVSKLKIDYATLMKSSSGKILHKMATINVPDAMRYNQQAKFTTEPMDISSYRSSYSSYSYKDSILGMMVRVRDQENKTVYEWKTSSSKMAKHSWAQIDAAEKAKSGSRRSSSSSGSTLKPTTGDSTLTIE